MIKRAVLAGLIAAGALGIVPAPSHATSCVPDVQQTTIDDKVVGRTCTDCGWIMVRGQAYTLFYCD